MFSIFFPKYLEGEGMRSLQIFCPLLNFRTLENVSCFSCFSCFCWEKKEEIFGEKLLDKNGPQSHTISTQM